MEHIQAMVENMLPGNRVLGLLSEKCLFLFINVEIIIMEIIFITKILLDHLPGLILISLLIALFQNWRKQ